MRKIKVKVSNDNERNAVLKAWEKNGCKWLAGYALPDFTPQRNYPYYLFREDDKSVTHGGVFTGDIAFDYKEVPFDKFRKFMVEQPVINIYSDGKKVKAVRDDGKIGVARCSPEDEFDLSVGAKLAIDRLDTIKTGDTVRVENNGELYRGFYSFFGEYKLPVDWAGRYQYTQPLPNGAVGKVLAIQTNCGRKIAVLNIGGEFGHEDRGRIYLVGVDGLKKV